MTPLAILPLIALFSTIFLIYIMFSRVRRNQSAFIWIFMLFFFLLWTVGEFAQKWLGDDPAVMKWTALMIIHGDLFPAIFLIFTLVFPYPNETFRKNQTLFILLIAGPKVVSTIITLSFGDFNPPQNWTDDFHHGYYPFIIGLKHQVSPIGEWYYYFGLIHAFILMSLGAFVLIWNAWRSNSETVQRETRFVLIGFTIYMVIGASTGFILPMLENFDLPELTSLGNLLLNFIVAYGLLQGRVLLFQPTAETQETKDFSDTLQIGDFYICSTDKGIKTFTELVNHGYEGLYVGAIKPNLDITKFKRTPIVILTERGKGLRQYGNLQYVPADELKTFKASIFTFIASASRGVIFLDNMDVILEKGWADPKEFVEMGTQMRDSTIINAIWMFGTPLKTDETIERLKNVMEYPVVKKAVVLEKLNTVLAKMDVDRTLVNDQLKRLSRVEPLFSYIALRNDHLVYSEGIEVYEGILGMDPTNPLRLFLHQFQTHISADAYGEILKELHAYGISRFEFLLRPGDSYLIEETFQDRGKTYEVYQDFLEKGFRGVCISRMEPTKVRERYLLPSNSEIFWLTQDRKEENDIKPAPEYLMVNIKNFIEAHGREPGIILLDGLEYLITFQGDQFDSYLKVLRRISDLISQSKLMLLIPYDPEAIPADRIAIFRRSGIEVITRDMLA